MSTPSKVIKKGEVLFKEGDKVTHLHLIQSGAISICLQRPKKNVELINVGPGHVTGELALGATQSYPYTGVATTETKVVEIPLETFKQNIETSSQMVKVLIKSIVDRIKLMSNDIKTMKMEKEPMPCPEDQVPQIFGAIFHTANHKGSKDAKVAGKVFMDWTPLKNYAQRVFGESPKRLEQALCIFVKLKICSFEMGRPPEDPEGPEQIMKVHFADLGLVEAFFEFYQYHYYKGGAKSEVLKVDEGVFSNLSNLLAICEGVAPDRNGIVTLEYQKVMEKFKSDYNINLNSDHFNRFEQKGLFAKRQARTDGMVVLQFELKEFKNTYQIWKVLKEIEKWNEKGFVDLNEDEAKAKKKGSENLCPQCQAGLQAQAKFCSECGYKIAV